MKKIFVFFLILLTAPLIAGLYGILNDQLSYTISPEYYTKFKFLQFGLIEEGVVPSPADQRLFVCVVGVGATWWMGLIIGAILAFVGLSHPGWKQMLRVTMRAVLIVVIVTFLFGLAGLAYGHLVLASQPREAFPNWYIPDNLVHFSSFIKAGSMHNFSYLGGVVGLFIGIFYSLGQLRKSRSASV
jgi:amino acid transporter